MTVGSQTVPRKEETCTGKNTLSAGERPPRLAAREGPPGEVILSLSWRSERSSPGREWGGGAFQAEGTVCSGGTLVTRDRLAACTSWCWEEQRP